MSFDLKSLVDAKHTIALEIVITNILTGAGVWNGRCSDGIEHMRVLDGEENHLSVYGSIWEIEHQTRHLFFFEISWNADSYSFEWFLSFDLQDSSARRRRNASFAADDPRLLAWKTALSGKAIEQGGALAITETFQ